MKKSNAKLFLGNVLAPALYAVCDGRMSRAGEATSVAVNGTIPLPRIRRTSRDSILVRCEAVGREDGASEGSEERSLKRIKVRI